MDLEYIAKGLSPKARPNSGGWMTCCPAHEDHNPSLSLKLEGDKLLWYCFAGCEQDAVRKALGDTGLYSWKPAEGSSRVNMQRGTQKDAFIKLFKEAIHSQAEEVDADELVPVAIGDFCAQDWPPVTPIIGPINRGSVTLLGGGPGVGKSWLAMALCNAVGGGHQLANWPAPEVARALLVDGELSGSQTAQRQAAMLYEGPYDTINSLELAAQGKGRLNLMDPRTRTSLMEVAVAYDLIVLDNLFGLFPTTEKLTSVSVEHWQQIDEFLSTLKRLGCAVVLFDHMAEYNQKGYPGPKDKWQAGKLQGSTSKRWAADLVGVLMRDSTAVPGFPPSFMLSFSHQAGGKVREEWTPAVHNDRNWMLSEGWFTSPFAM